MIFMVFRLNKVLGNDFEILNYNCKVLGCGWRIGFEKLKEYYGMSCS